MVDEEKSDSKAAKVAATIPLGWIPRYYPAFKYLGLPAGSNCLPGLQVKVGSGSKKNAKVISRKVQRM